MAHSSRSGWSMSQQAHRQTDSAVTGACWSAGAGTDTRAASRQRGFRSFGRPAAQPASRGTSARIGRASCSGERTAMVNQPLPAVGDGPVADSREVAPNVLVHQGLVLPTWMERMPTAELDVRGAPEPRCRRNAAPVQGEACLRVHLLSKANHRARPLRGSFR